MTEPALIERVRSATAHVAVIGQGYVGLPLAVEFARAGFTVTGVDTDLDRIARLNAGSSYIPDVRSEVLAALVADGRYSATGDTGVLRAADVASLDVRTARCQLQGAHRRSHEAVRVHGLLPGFGDPRALHPRRLALPLVEDAA